MLVWLLVFVGFGIGADNLHAAPGADEDEIQRELDEILSKPQFRRVHLRRNAEPAETTDVELPQWVEDFFNWLARMLRKMNGAFSGFGTVAQILAYGVLAIVCGLIVYLIVQTVRGHQRKKSAVGTVRNTATDDFDPAPGELSTDAYLLQAMELAKQGRFREAMGQLVLGAMSYTERQGLIRFRRGLTYRDYLRALAGRGSPREAFQSLVQVYEPVCFGRREATAEHYESVLAAYRTGIQNA